MSVEQGLTRVLGSWAAGSVVVGAALSVSPRTRGFGRQTAAWGAIDGAIAYAGIRGRNRKGPTDPARLTENGAHLKMFPDLAFFMRPRRLPS